MSIVKQNTTIPDTLRTFESNKSIYKETESIFITPEDFTCSVDDFADADFWYDNLGINIFPLHGISEFTPEDRKKTLTESLQDFSYETVPEKYRQRIKYDWSLDYHKLVNEISGQSVNIIYASNRVLRATLNDSGDVKGFSVSAFILEGLMFSLNESNGDSELFLELLDAKELNENGYDVEVDWQPKKMDRLVLNVKLSFGADTITMLIKYLSNTITGIKSSDITITDDKNGDITFDTFIPGDGIYVLGGFSNVITKACLYIKSTVYIGAKRFTYTVSIGIDVPFSLLDDDSFALLDDDAFYLLEQQ